MTHAPRECTYRHIVQNSNKPILAHEGSYRFMLSFGNKLLSYSQRKMGTWQLDSNMDFCDVLEMRRLSTQEFQSSGKSSKDVLCKLEQMTSLNVNLYNTLWVGE